MFHGTEPLFVLKEAYNQILILMCWLADVSESIQSLKIQNSEVVSICKHVIREYDLM